VLSGGDIDLGGGIVVASRELRVRTTTSGGPGGQHANRTESRVVVTFDIAHADSLSDDVRAMLVDRIGPTVTSASSSSRSQLENRRLALERLARRLAAGLEVVPPRRATRPTKSSVDRRIAGKRRRGEIKTSRRMRDDD